MNRRKAMKVTAGALAGGGIGLFTMANAFKTEKQPDAGPQQLDYSPSKHHWKYAHLTPAVSAEMAYNYYSEGSCMYATVKSIIAQLAEKYGEPYASFPMHMFKYGHGGVGGYGSVCGTLNGAAALIGLLIPDKSMQDKMIGDIFQWYEKEAVPTFNPVNPAFDYTPVTSVSNSVLCHASNTNWCNVSGFGVGSTERKERCRRLTGDVAKKITMSLNEIHADNYITNKHGDKAAGTCISCHGKEGKVSNAAVKMSCNSCHTESMGHRIFSDVHYRLMKK